MTETIGHLKVVLSFPRASRVPIHIEALLVRKVMQSLGLSWNAVISLAWGYTMARFLASTPRHKLSTDHLCNRFSIHERWGIELIGDRSKVRSRGKARDTQPSVSGLECSALIRKTESCVGLYCPLAAVACCVAFASAAASTRPGSTFIPYS
jgi:Arc/MetJ family transcription regulator